MLLGAAVLFVGIFAPAKNEEGMVLSEFRIRQTDKQGKPSWQLEGKQAEVGGVTVSMKDVKLRVFRVDKADLTVTSPSADYNRATQVISGPGPVHAETEDFVIDGRGYRMTTEKQRLYIENDVRMVIEHADSAFDLTAPRGNINSKSDSPAAAAADSEKNNE